MTDKSAKDVAARQDPLRERYKHAAEDAVIVDRARTVFDATQDPWHGTVVPGSKDYGVEWAFGIHEAVGGDHDAPNPGDMLCAALAACLDSTIRIIAERLGVPLEHLEIDVAATVDVRGTLMVEREVPVGFSGIRCNVDLKAAEGTDPGVVQKLIGASERCCVNFQTLCSNVNIETTYGPA